MILILPNTETVSTPGLMSESCEWPKIRLKVEASSASSKLKNFELSCKLVMVVLTFNML